MWMYSTISPNLVDMVIDYSAPTHGVWKRLQDIFHDNKDARIIQLDNEIHNMHIGSLSITKYFQEIKSKANYYNEHKISGKIDDVVYGVETGEVEKTWEIDDNHDRMDTEFTGKDVQVKKPTVEKPKGVSTSFANAYASVSGSMKTYKNTEAMLDVKVEDVFDDVLYKLKDQILNRDYDNEKLGVIFFPPHLYNKEVEDPIFRNNKWYQSLVRSFDQEKNNIQAQQKKKMVKSSSSSENVACCSKACKKNTDGPNSKITELSKKLDDTKNIGLELKVELKTKTIECFTNELELLKKEKEGLDSKLTGFQSAFKDLDNLLESQRSNKNKEELGYSAVPPSCSSLLSSQEGYVLDRTL
uniref:Zein-binding domain-containing protein n=1 Tax=Tanacetum cinerariifolium TaxID=118510 RepID=A0A6L2NKV3_TANCI|nr:zein-binding domain-containing protein [Tanacetum cinerariifolium]